MKKALWILLALVLQDPPATDRVENWQADLDELGRVISERHKNPFFKVARDDWFKAIADVRKRLPDLTDSQIACEFMKLGAMIGDGHTVVRPSGLRRYPITPMWCKDGLFIIATDRERKDLQRARIVAVERTPVDEAARRVGAVSASDNVSGAKNLSAHWLACPEVLAGVGIVDDMEKAAYSIIDAEGKERTIELAPVGETFKKVFALERDLPVSRRLERFAYGHELLPKSKVLYAWYDRCADVKLKPVAAWCAEALAAIDEHKPERFVLDVRRNGGGNSMLIQPLIMGLKKRREVLPAGSVFVLVDRPTFSSALLNAIEFKRDLKAVLIGVAPGGSPNHYGEIRTLPLPRSQWTVQYSTKLFKNAPDGTTELKPDVEVEWTGAEFFSGADPALDAALRWEAPKD